MLKAIRFVRDQNLKPQTAEAQGFVEDFTPVLKATNSWSVMMVKYLRFGPDFARDPKEEVQNYNRIRTILHIRKEEFMTYTHITYPTEKNFYSTMELWMMVKFHGDLLAMNLRGHGRALSSTSVVIHTGKYRRGK